jgi:hypothetical protein
MTIGGEKAPAFSAKTLNLPPTPNNATNQIIELSRQRYAQEKTVVERVVEERMGRTSAAPASPTGNQNTQGASSPAPQVARPKAQAQLNHVQQYQSQAENANKAASTLIKAVTSGASGSNESASLQVQESTTQQQQPHQQDDEQAPKRKRTRRGGRKNKKKTMDQPNNNQPQAQAPATQPQKPFDSEQVINLR